jgi:excisionase family DNA binding protein
MNKEAHLMTVSQVARRLSLSSERVRQLARSGRLPPDQTTELGRLWLPETIERFAATRGRWGRYEAPDRAADGKEVDHR